ncbi:SIR2 family protein [Rheinheimera nanhaiensis]|uniref:Novel STAND NTPase 5 domain-containing protein n=1 Tax=Rheinheimera nanhaiensis E407-8 TaxID=562729 RepID=I1DSR8_9GAMM|nr:SIR2 family protein [Rheinheimera nanhaiensis]GAB57096.1 hypothetical protein RNAN_0059 [Rheinheimera nanhaiensis E407-8]
MINIIDKEFNKSVEIIKSCILSSGLIPILGSGFTRNCEAKNAKVPDGKQLKEIMIRTLIKSSADENLIAALKDSDLKKVSKSYLKHSKKELIIQDLTSYFTEVKLDKLKKDFINNDWKYIYTLNIDDAIERENKKIKKVLPYKKLQHRIRDHHLLYKIHGCATEEITYSESDSLIFSDAQYIRSLTKNESILNALKNDISESNIIYIGCSLDREIDIIHAVSGAKEDKSVSSKRIFFTRQTPDTITLDSLEDYNINTVIIVNDFDEIYKIVNTAFNSEDFDDKIDFENFKSSNIFTVEKDKNKNINFLLQNFDNNSELIRFGVPYYISKRSITPDVINSINKNNVTIIKGRRFSGKSLLLKTITIHVKDRNVYYIPSDSSISSEDIDKLTRLSNSVVLIDSNVVSYEEAYTLRKEIKALKNNNVSILIACNPTEVDVSNVFLTPEFEDNFFELRNSLDDHETSDINRNLSLLGIIEWKRKQTILNNTYNSSIHYPYIRADFLHFKEDIQNNELKLLLILAVLDKVYISISRHLGFGNSESAALAKKFNPLLEIIETDRSERNHKSKFKIVVNSKVWLFNAINGFSIKNGAEKTKNIIIELISEFYRNIDLNPIAKKVIMFDTINQFFFRREGAGKLLIGLYSDLESILSNDPDYWLQRAKAMDRILKDQPSLMNAIDYAKKAFFDSTRDKTTMNAEFTIANLYGKLCFTTNYSNIDFIKEALFWYNSSISKYNFNQNYVNSLLDNTVKNKGHLHKLMKNILSTSMPFTGESKQHFNNILQFLKSNKND